MQTILIFLSKSIVISSLLFIYYWLFLRNKKLYQFNRFYLLGIAVVSVLLPFMHFEWYSVATSSTDGAFTILQAIKSADEAENIVPASAYFNTDKIILYTYVIVSLYFLTVLALRIIWILKLKRTHAKECWNGIVIVHTGIDKAPFSFLNSLFWKDSIAMDSNEGALILRHECVHIQQKHTADKLFMQLVLILFWINPIYWFIQKELSLVHEYIADEAAVTGNNTEQFARMLLQTHYTGYFPKIIQPFFYSPIKRRLIMLTTSNKTSYSYLRRLLVLPLLGITLFLFSFSLNKNVNVNRSHKKIIMVLDAGHGGKDIGVTGVNGIQEKDLTLKIANTISQLAEAYNIEVVPTRKDDSYPTLDERAQKVKESSANLLVSIHVNDEHGVVNGNGYELCVDRTNIRKTESNMLASAIASKLNLMNIRPVLIEKGLHVLRNCDAPAVLIECGYINNKQEMEVINNEKKLEQLCRNILSGVVDYETAASKK
jgi:N-acetylmuramoyl-L-alanine amidase